VLCAYGDATTRVRDEASRTFIRRFPHTDGAEVAGILRELEASATATLDAENVSREEQSTDFQVDIRYHGQGLLLTVDVDFDDLEQNGLATIGAKFDDLHKQLFTFALSADKEIVNLRAVVQGKATMLKAPSIEQGDSDPSEAAVGTETIFIDDSDQDATIYDRSKLKAGNRIAGPAIVVEMDSTALIQPGHTGEVDSYGNILIRPDSA
jgi:N-methylhydantoinase A